MTVTQPIGKSPLMSFPRCSRHPPSRFYRIIARSREGISTCQIVTTHRPWQLRQLSLIAFCFSLNELNRTTRIQFELKWKNNRYPFVPSSLYLAHDRLKSSLLFFSLEYKFIFNETWPWLATTTHVFGCKSHRWAN